jgi:ATP-dependent protease ClpP protease subunit
MKILTTMFLSLATSAACAAPGIYSFGGNEEVTIEIKGEIRERTTHAAREIQQAVQDGADSLTILINSPGGYLHIAQEIIDSIYAAEDAGLEITCIAVGQIASAAWLIYNACPNREAYHTAHFLWHSVSLGLMGGYNIFDLRKMLGMMEALQFEMNYFLLTELKIELELFNKWWMFEETVSAELLKKVAPHYLHVIQKPGSRL